MTLRTSLFYDSENKLYNLFVTYLLKREIFMKKRVGAIAILSAMFVLASCEDNNSSIPVSSKNEESSSQIISSESSSESSSNEEISSSEPSSSIDDSKVTNIKFIIKTVNVNLNENAQLQWKIYPSTAKVKDVVFSIEDEDVASVSSNGIITGLKVGTTTVTIITLDGNFSDTATINVVGQQATGIKLIVPDNTIQDDNGNYLIKVDQKIQLSYELSPNGSINTVTYATSTSSGDAAAYLSVSKGGILTGRKYKIKITVSVTTDNLFTDSVTFSVVKDSIYSQYLLKNTLQKSTELEKENVVSGTKKIVHIKKKSSIDDETTETFNIYTNGVSRNYTEKDKYLNKSKTYDGFYGIYNNKFYQLIRNGSDYSTSSVTNIGDGSNEISLDTAKEYSSLAYYRTHYGLANIIQSEYIDSSLYFGYSGDWMTYTLEEKDNSISVKASFEKTASSYYETLYYREISLTITTTSEGMISGYTFTSYDYDSTSYDFTNHELSENPTTIETVEHTFTQTSGTRVENASFALEPSQCYFTSFDVNVVNSTDSSEILYVGDYLKFTVSNALPSTATTTIDRISYLSSSNENVVKYSSAGGLRAVGEGNATITFSSSGGVTSSVNVSVSYKAPESVSISTSKDYVKIGETLDNITVSVLPYGAKDDASISIISGNEYASLTYDETNKSYSLSGIAKGKVVLQATSNVDNAIISTKSIYVYEELSENDVLATLLKNKYVTTASTNSKTYILTFLENGKGKVVDGFEDYSTTYATFEYAISGFSIVISNLKSANTSLLYSLDTLTLANTGLTISGKMQTSTSSYTKKTYTFSLYEE